MAKNDEEKQFSRRDFLKTSGAMTGGLIGGSLLGGLVGFNLDGYEENSNNESSSPDTDVDADTSTDSNAMLEARSFFKRADDFTNLSEATEMIFPEDDLGPGAIGLGVPYFIDRQLVTPWGLNIMDYMEPPFTEGEIAINRQDLFLDGLRALQETSMEAHDTNFSELEDKQKIEILQQFENDEVEMKYVNSSVFFAALRSATLEGAYSDPMYGGNKNMEGWKMKEYPGVQRSYRDLVEEDQAADAEFILIEPKSLGQQFG